MASFVPTARRVLLQATLLLGAIATAGPARALAKTNPSSLRYASAAYGYALRLPTSWVRLPGVRWTPGGPTADLTIMTPDHQADLGVIVAPTGNRIYSDAELQSVALRLMSQENYIAPSVKIETKKVVVNGVAYEAAQGYVSSGFPLMATFVAAAVTQRHRRLYAVVSLAYVQEFTAAQGGFSATPTPQGNSAPLRRAPSTSLLAARALSVGARGWMAGLPRKRRLAPPAPLPTDRLRGDQCRTNDDAGLNVVDKNCAFAAQSQTLTAMFSSFTIDPRAEDDRRPAAVVGVDGFRSLSDPAQGYRIEYPAQWASASAPGTLVFLRSADQNAGVGVAVKPIAPASLSESDLSVAADRQIATMSSLPGSITHQTVHVGASTFVIAYASGAGVTLTGGSLGQAQIAVVVTASRHRLYATTGLGLTVLGANDDVTPILYPYFSPFTTLARRYQGLLDTHGQEAQLALRAALTLVVAP